MPTEEILALLITERDKLNRAIEALSGPTKRQGRPQKSAAAHAEPTAPKKTKKKRNFSPEQREAARVRAKAMWAKRKRAAKKGG